MTTITITIDITEDNFLMPKGSFIDLTRSDAMPTAPIQTFWVDGERYFVIVSTSGTPFLAAVEGQRLVDSVTGRQYDYDTEPEIVAGARKVAFNRSGNVWVLDGSTRSFTRC
jgi:hypothetical protein